MFKYFRFGCQAFKHPLIYHPLHYLIKHCFNRNLNANKLLKNARRSMHTSFGNTFRTSLVKKCCTNEALQILPYWLQLFIQLTRREYIFYSKMSELGNYRMTINNDMSTKEAFSPSQSSVTWPGPLASSMALRKNEKRNTTPLLMFILYGGFVI